MHILFLLSLLNPRAYVQPHQSTRTYVYMYIYIYVHTHISVSIYTYKCIYIYIQMCVLKRKQIFLCGYMYICIYIYVACWTRWRSPADSSLSWQGSCTLGCSGSRYRRMGAQKTRRILESMVVESYVVYWTFTHVKRSIASQGSLFHWI